MESIKINIDPADVASALHGIHDLTRGMTEGIFVQTATGVLRVNERFSEGENARDFILYHYNTVAGALRLIAATTNIICTGLTDGDLNITGSLQKIEGGN